MLETNDDKRYRLFLDSDFIFYAKIKKLVISLKFKV